MYYYITTIQVLRHVERKTTNCVLKGVDPDQMLCSVAYDLDLHSL